jgi:oligoribonuclease NrnB/cAMP/cGMP phosphodiesterase (DHH superfamily)
MMIMRVLLISHESDLDGLVSAAIGLVRYPQAKTVFLGNKKESFEALARFVYTFSVSSISLSSQEKGLIIICDLALIEDELLINLCKDAFSEAKKAGFHIVWLDHHPWSEAARLAIDPFVETMFDETGNRCAAELVYGKFLLGNELANKLASMAHSMDFLTNDQYLPPISELIVYYHNNYGRYERLSSLATKVSRGILWDIDMQNDYAIYSQIQKKAKVEAFQTIQFKQIDGRFKAAFIQSSPYIQNSLFAQEVFEKTHSDVVILYSSDSRVSIRRNNSLISCRRIAQNLPEGGGHEFAAGARFKSNPLNRDEIIGELEEAILKSLVDTQTCL